MSGLALRIFFCMWPSVKKVWTPLLYPAGPDEEWGRHMPAETSMPPTGSANNEFLKGTTGWGEVFFYFLKALLRDFFLGVHAPELSTAFSSLSALLQLLTQRADLLSPPQSSYCLQLGGLGTHRPQQLTHWEWPLVFGHCFFLQCLLYFKIQQAFALFQMTYTTCPALLVEVEHLGNVD